MSLSEQKPIIKTSMMAVRRFHLYLGLLLFPWAVLYGVTAFLFNHPQAFSSQTAIRFGRETTRGTPVESLPQPNQIADQLIAKLNDSQKPETPYSRAGEAKFNREFSFATVKSEALTINLLIDAKHGTGTIRSQQSATIQPSDLPRAPFANGIIPSGERRQQKGRDREGGGLKLDDAQAIKIDHPLHDRFKLAIPAILEKHGLANGDVTITSVPDLVVPIKADGSIWIATYNPMTGIVTGKPDEPSSVVGDTDWRRFLLRLHTAHGYPEETNARWWWAVIVDVMAFVMCFWGVSGLVMWWQLKQQRRLGLILLVLSAILATASGFGMHAAMTG
jgi:hypothetical protein